jgi:hypothetical protein
MLIVPKQLKRSGMTGNVPYYGGRLTPAQAWAASHPSAPPLGSTSGGPPAAPVRMPVPSGQPSGQVPAPATSQSSLDALQHLRDTGVLTSAEYDDLRRRVTP